MSLTFKIGRTNFFLPYIVTDGIFTDKELDQLSSYCEDNSFFVEGRIGTGDVNKDIRSSQVKALHIKKQNKWIFNRFKRVIEDVNNDYYRFDLTGFDFFQYSSYNGEGAKYDMHMDIHTGVLPYSIHQATPRKLSMSFLLSTPGVDFEGGELEVQIGSKPTTIDLKKGQAVFFPSWVLHRVAPIIRGCRKSIVIWVLGPRFK